jgi:hypothetical protein
MFGLYVLDNATSVKRDNILNLRASRRLIRAKNVIFQSLKTMNNIIDQLLFITGQSIVVYYFK